jgi:hypothetical protein
MTTTTRFGILVAFVMAVLCWQDGRTAAQSPASQPPAGRAGGGRVTGPPPDPTKPAKLTLSTGSKARYRVREQLAGISFPSDAVGTTETVTGAIVVNPDGSVDAAQSKITVDLKTLSSDQQMRDGFIQNRTLEVPDPRIRPQAHRRVDGSAADQRTGGVPARWRHDAARGDGRGRLECGRDVWQRCGRGSRHDQPDVRDVQADEAIARATPQRR